MSPSSARVFARAISAVEKIALAASRILISAFIAITFPVSVPCLWIKSRRRMAGEQAAEHAALVARIDTNQNAYRVAQAARR
jgi:hypothetical protein